MDPQIKSILTTIAVGFATTLATWAAAVGIIPASSESTVINALVSLLLYVIDGLLAWYKARSQSKDALIQAVNAGNNKVKVVADSPENASIPVVNKALK